MPKSKCKKVRVEQKSAEQKLCDPAEQKLVESFGLWVMGTHKSKCKRSDQNKNEWNKNCVTQQNKNQWNKNWWEPLDLDGGGLQLKCKKVRAEQK